MRRSLSQKIYNVMSEALRVTVNYIKAECIMFLINFAVVLAGMIIAGLKWWSPLIALGVCLVDFLPVLGSGMVFIPWAVISIINGNAKMAVCVGVTYIVMVVARMIFEPIITGKAVGLSPLITLLAAVFGMFIFGGSGLFIGPIVVSVANSIYRMRFKNNERKSY